MNGGMAGAKSHRRRLVDINVNRRSMYCNVAAARNDFVLLALSWKNTAGDESCGGIEQNEAQVVLPTRKRENKRNDLFSFRDPMRDSAVGLT